MYQLQIYSLKSSHSDEMSGNWYRFRTFDDIEYALKQAKCFTVPWEMGYAGAQCFSTRIVNTETGQVVCWLLTGDLGGC